jgi:hypothetical protein
MQLSSIGARWRIAVPCRLAVVSCCLIASAVSAAEAQTIVALDSSASTGFALPSAPAPSLELGDSDGSRTGGVMLDDAVRNAFRLGSADARAAADLTSDILMYTLAAAPFMENVYAVADGDRSWSDYWQHLTVDFAALGLTYGIVQLIKHTVSRDRPFVNECLRSGAAAQCYSDGGAQQSFLSGHTALAFTGAGLVCAHAANGEDDTVSNTACAASMVLAAVTGGLRIMADAHYASDVLAGATLGLVMGYFLPRIALDL